jgi:hypothetical protein
MPAELKIYTDSACTQELIGSLSFGELNGTTGETKVISLMVKNTGDAINSNVVLTETLDTSARVSYSLDDITYHQTTITLGDMNASDVIRIYVKVVVTASTLTELSTQATFTIAGDDADEDVVIVYSILTFLDEVKTLLRISNTAFDTEINDLIDAVKAELGLVGINDNLIVVTDPLIRRAVMTYVKANFGWDNPDSEKLQKSYEMLRNHLTLSGDYSFYVIAFDVGVRAVITLDGVAKDTDENGLVSFYLRSKNNVDYTVVADGYVTQTDVIDVKQSETITLVLVGV